MKKVVLGIGFLLFVLAPLALIVLPLRTHMRLTLALSSSAGSSQVGAGEVALIGSDGRAFGPRYPFEAPTQTLFMSIHGKARAVRVYARSCEPKTVSLEGCESTFRFTDAHRYLHHGSASRYDRFCEVRAELSCK